ncbi:MAG: tetratricopeptide repeat protein [Cellvibrionaceae bacterium]
MRLGVAVRAVVLGVFLVGCQSGPAINHAEHGTQAPIHSQGNQSSGASYEPTAPASVAPNATSTAPAEPGPALIIQELRQQAETHLRDQRWASSIALAEQGLRIDRRQPAFYLILSESYLALGDLTQAQRFADQASRLCGNSCSRANRLQRRLASEL